MNTMQQQVKEFHDLFGVPVLDKPQLPVQERLHLRAKLIDEEAEETINALINNDIIEAADGMADLCYVVFGTALELGIDLQKVFDEVHRSNMTKAWAMSEVIDHLPEGCNANEMCPGQYIVKNAYGKVIKSPGYMKADIKTVLEELNA